MLLPEVTPLKICILDPSYENSDSPMKDYDPLSDVFRHLEGHECETAYIDKAKGVRQIIELSRRDFDVFINLCDGAWDEDRAGVEIVQTMERLGMAFTGATASFYEPSRETMKKSVNSGASRRRRMFWQKTMRASKWRPERSSFPDRQTPKQLRQHRFNQGFPR